ESASIVVNGRKGLNEHSHRGAPAVALSSARPAISRAACPLVGHPKAAPQHGASNSYSAARSSQSRPLMLPTPNGATSPAITASAMAVCPRDDTGFCKGGRPEMFYSVDRSGLYQTGGTLNLWQQDPVLGRPFWRL